MSERQGVLELDQDNQELLFSTSIYQELAKLQIIQARPVQLSADSWMLEHPGKGPLTVDPSSLAWRDHLARVEGIGLSGPSKLTIFDYGGIWDPMAEKVVGDQYAASHFAWLTCLLGKPDDRRRQVLAAFSFHEKTFRSYPFSKESHWEFNNLAWMEIWPLIKDNYPELGGRLKSVLLSSPWHPRPYGTNWKFMLAAFLLLRHKAFGRPLDRILGLFYLAWGLRMQDRDGCLLDVPRHGSRSLQYHAYCTALLFRMCDNEVIGPAARKRALIAARWLLAHISPDGDCIWRGRGQGQLFGYAAASYVFRAAAQRDAEHKNAYLTAHHKLLSCISKYRRTDGLWPLVLNGYLDEKHIGWYDYNYLTVYNAFAGVWFALPPHHPAKNSSNIQSKPETPRRIYFPYSGVAIVNTDRLFLSVSSGGRAYAAEAGLTPQIIWIKGIGTIIRGAGGVGQGRYGQLYCLPQELYNYMTPLVLSNKAIIGPEGKRYNISYRKNSVLLKGAYGGIWLSREINWSGQNDTLLIIRDSIVSEEEKALVVIPINIPLLVEKATLESFQTSELVIIGKEARLAMTFLLNSSPITIEAGDIEPQALGPTLRIASPAMTLRPGESLNILMHWTLIG